MAVLYCAVNQAFASAVLAMGSAVSPKCTSVQSQAGFKEDDLDSNAISLVEEALNMFSYIGTTIKNSTRAGGHVSKIGFRILISFNLMRIFFRYIKTISFRGLGF